MDPKSENKKKVITTEVLSLKNRARHVKALDNQHNAWPNIEDRLLLLLLSDLQLAARLSGSPHYISPTRKSECCVHALTYLSSAPSSLHPSLRIAIISAINRETARLMP